MQDEPVNWVLQAEQLGYGACYAASSPRFLQMMKIF
ncbi:hypothetical protein AAUPMC_18569 [Pasteurella multocida subsp. multocida str. Anand1_cattle]|nr:hypothetical protein AAUPMC_18569 [Pasteurella multocida subsp. multocida str. Anand1_cattle]